MATIIMQRDLGWCFDVIATFSDGVVRVLSFPTRPTDVQAAANAEEQKFLESSPVFTVEGE